MDYEAIKLYDQEKRDKILKDELGVEKAKVLERFELHSNGRLYWERSGEHYPTQEYFSHKFARKASPLGMIFHIYRLCYAKVKYFDSNWEDFAACCYDWKNGGFVECPVYEMDFIKQKSTGIIIDLRNLAKINRIEDFRLLCEYLESRKP